MYIFNSDLDNTLIYSYKHDIGTEKTGVEVYQDRVISYMTNRTVQLLKDVVQKAVFVPTTTRTVEQYKRIDLGTGTPQYALVCNGGILLEDGVESPEWYQGSIQLVETSWEEMWRGQRLLRDDKRRIFELRCIRDLFVFTKCDKPELVVRDLRGALDISKVDVFHNGAKVYIVPKQLNKGTAVIRLKEKTGAEAVIAAGDSEFDIAMIERADFAVAPESLKDRLRLSERIFVVGDQERFSEKMLERVIALIDGNRCP